MRGVTPVIYLFCYRIKSLILGSNEFKSPEGKLISSKSVRVKKCFSLYGLEALSVASAILDCLVSSMPLSAMVSQKLGVRFEFCLSCIAVLFCYIFYKCLDVSSIRIVVHQCDFLKSFDTINKKRNTDILSFVIGPVPATRL